jgi:hypothetical protein
MLSFALALALGYTDWPKISDLRPLSAEEVRTRVVGHSTRCPGDVSFASSYAFGADGSVTISGDPGAFVTTYEVEEGGVTYRVGGSSPMRHIALYGDNNGGVYQAWEDGRAKPICLITLPRR